MIYVKINSIDKEAYCISVYIYITTMGGGVSIDRCVDEFNAAIVNRETDENCKQKEKQLSNEEKIELKKLAALVFNENNKNPEDVSQTLVKLKQDLFSEENSQDLHVKQLKEEFLKYLTIQVMQHITKQAVEDVFKDLLSGDNDIEAIEESDIKK